MDKKVFDIFQIISAYKLKGKDTGIFKFILENY